MSLTGGDPSGNSVGVSTSGAKFLICSPTGVPGIAMRGRREEEKEEEE
eukprot:CAMPEP_0170175322 /NCGR_PEP_ID=MMETSP0040_2-20121228/8419_1 /TAXON_ID=641309 /ORGANISM="Lotharella oceanica, Strain CCMP622" /LENGTH=47 /DNA_ID= /DNA_START= /DNA_END= /DNA_ORIENTATION=